MNKGWLVFLCATIGTCHAHMAHAQAKPQDDAQQRAAAHAASRPSCTSVDFAGLVVGGDPGNLIAVRDAKDPEDLVATNPLECHPSAVTQTWTCYGAAYLTWQHGFIINWTDWYFQIVTPIDLTVGRRDTMVFIERGSAECADDVAPSLEPAENLMKFFRTQNLHR